MRIKKGDQVQMLSGKDRGKRGKVARIFPTKGKLIIEGLNLVKRHRKPKKSGEKGQRIEVPSAVSIAKVMLVCPACGKPSRIGFQIQEKNKSRVCKRCKAEVKV